MQQLPDSLCSAILELCDVKALLNMCLLCRQLAQIAQRHVFGKLSIGLVRTPNQQDEGVLLKQSVEKGNKVINTLLLRPDLATAVREIHIDGIVSKAGLMPLITLCPNATVVRLNLAAGVNKSALTNSGILAASHLQTLVVDLSRSSELGGLRMTRKKHCVLQAATYVSRGGTNGLQSSTPIITDRLTIHNWVTNPLHFLALLRYIGPGIREMSLHACFVGSRNLVRLLEACADTLQSVTMSDGVGPFQQASFEDEEYVADELGCSSLHSLSITNFHRHVPFERVAALRTLSISGTALTEADQMLSRINREWHPVLHTVRLRGPIASYYPNAESIAARLQKVARKARLCGIVFDGDAVIDAYKAAVLIEADHVTHASGHRKSVMEPLGQDGTSSHSSVLQITRKMGISRTSH